MWTTHLCTEEVWVWNGEKSKARKGHFAMRREVNLPEKRKYCLNNVLGDSVPREQAVFVRNYTKDEGRSLGVGLQEQAPNHLKLLW